jgi:hypothetical protein
MNDVGFVLGVFGHGALELGATPLTLGATPLTLGATRLPVRGEGMRS